MKLVFLDRDGVINRFPGDGEYVTRVKDFQFLPGALQAIRKLTEHGYTLFVISNQAGVAKGLMTQDKLNRITKKLLVGVERAGGKIEGVYYSIKKNGDGCPYRKPNIGSVQLALKSVGKNMRAAKKAFFIGDARSDIQTGVNAGCRTIFVLTGKEKKSAVKKWDVSPDYVAKDLSEAAEIILKKEEL